MVDETGSEPPITGAVCRVQPQWSHAEFLEAATPRYAMINLEDARRVLKRGEDATTFFPAETTVIATSTVDDKYLDIMPWKDNGFRRGELDIVQEFGPDYYVPMDHSDYNDLPIDERMSRIKSVYKGTLWMERKLGDSVELLPLLKGCTLEERVYSYRLFDELDAPMAAYYVVNYFEEAGNHISRLVDDLETITEETDLPLLLIGLLSPNYLARVPDQVVAGSGQYTWRDKVTPRKENNLSMRRTYEQIETDVAGALGLPTPEVVAEDQSIAQPTDADDAAL